MATGDPRALNHIDMSGDHKTSKWVKKYWFTFLIKTHHVNPPQFEKVNIIMEYKAIYSN